MDVRTAKAPRQRAHYHFFYFVTLRLLYFKIIWKKTILIFILFARSNFPSQKSKEQEINLVWPYYLLPTSTLSLRIINPSLSSYCLTNHCG